jgi:hypothetical protein
MAMRTTIWRYQQPTQLGVEAEYAMEADQVQEGVGQYAAIEERVERVLDKRREVYDSSVFGLGEEGRGVLLRQAVQRALFRALAPVADPIAFERPLGLLQRGLQAKGSNRRSKQLMILRGGRADVARQTSRNHCFLILGCT